MYDNSSKPEVKLYNIVKNLDVRKPTLYDVYYSYFKSAINNSLLDGTTVSVNSITKSLISSKNICITTGDGDVNFGDLLIDVLGSSANNKFIVYCNRKEKNLLHQLKKLPNVIPLYYGDSLPEVVKYETYDNIIMTTCSGKKDYRYEILMGIATDIYSLREYMTHFQIHVINVENAWSDLYSEYEKSVKRSDGNVYITDENGVEQIVEIK